MTPNCQSPRSSDGAMGKNGGDIMRASNVSASVSSPWSGSNRSTSRVVAIAGPEEGQALHMVPVQVAQQDGAAERRVAEQSGEASQAGAGIEQERRPARPPPSSCDSATQEVCPPKRM